MNKKIFIVSFALIILSLVVVYFFYINKTTILEKIGLYGGDNKSIKTDTKKGDISKNNQNRENSSTKNISQDKNEPKNNIKNNESSNEQINPNNNPVELNNEENNNIQPNHINDNGDSLLPEQITDNGESNPQQPVVDHTNETNNEYESYNKTNSQEDIDSGHTENYITENENVIDSGNNGNDSTDDGGKNIYGNIKIPGLTNYDGDVQILSELGVNDYDYILTDSNNSYFVYLGNKSTDTILDKIVQMGGDYVEIRDKKNIMQNMLFGDIVTFINLSHYKNSKVNMLVKFVDSNELWLVQVDYSKYYELKPHFVDLFNY